MKLYYYDKILFYIQISIINSNLKNILKNKIKFY